MWAAGLVVACNCCLLLLPAPLLKRNLQPRARCGLFLSERYPSHLGAQLSCRTPAGVKSTPAGDGVLYAKSISHMITHPPYTAVDVSPPDVLCHAVHLSTVIDMGQHLTLFNMLAVNHPLKKPLLS